MTHTTILEQHYVVRPIRRARTMGISGETQERGWEGMKIKLRAEEVLIIVMVLFALCWFGNAARFLATDFKPSYRCEVIYGMGILVPPLSLATVWVSCDE